MKENIGLIIIVVLGIIIFSVALYFLLRFLKGSIKIKLEKHGFGSGESINGSFQLITKKEIEGNRLFIALIGEEETTYYDGDTKKTRREEIYRYEHNLEDEKIYEAGTTEDYQFELPGPAEEQKDLPDKAGGLVKAIAIGAELFSGRRRRVKWYIEARLDAKGVDLASTQKISIN